MINKISAIAVAAAILSPTMSTAAVPNTKKVVVDGNQVVMMEVKAEVKSTEAKPVEAKPVEAKPVEAKPVEKKAPTAQDALKLLFNGKTLHREHYVALGIAFFQFLLPVVK